MSVARRTPLGPRALECKVLTGPRTLAVFLLVFLVVAAAVAIGAWGQDMPLREQWLRASFGATAIISLLAFCERNKPDPASA